MSKNINVVSSINSSSEKNNTVNLPNYDKEMLEDMIIACINQAQEEVDKISKEKMGALSGGMPGLPGF